MRHDNKMLAYAKKVINGFIEADSGQGADFSDLRSVSIGTMIEKDVNGNQHEIELTVNLVQPSINYFIDEELIEKESFLSIREVCEELEDFELDILAANMVYRVWVMGEEQGSGRERS